MDQTIINWLFAGVGTTLGWIMKVIWDAVQDLKHDIKQIEHELPEIYVRRDDFRIIVTDIKEMVKTLRDDMKEKFDKIDATLNLIFNKLEARDDDK